MMKTKITVRVEKEAYEAAKRYAEKYGMTITNLVTEFFNSLDKKEKAASRTPILDEMAGSLSPDTRIEDYCEYLEKKYGARE